MKNTNYGPVILLFIVLLSAVWGGARLIKKDREQEKIKIGIILPLTGPSASLSEDVQKSLIMYKRESKNIQLVTQDDQCSAKGALSAYTLLKEQGVKIYIVVCSGSILSLAPIVEKDGNVILTAFGGAIDIRKTGDEVIRFIPDGLTIAEGMIQIIKSQPQKKYALLTEQQDYSKSVGDKIQQEVSDRIVLREVYKADDLNFRAHILKIKESGIDTLIFVPVSESASEVMYKQMKELGLEVEILGDVNVCDGKIKPKDFGFHGTCFATVLETQGYFKYLKDFKEIYNAEPLYPFYNAINYDILSIVDRLLDDVSLVDRGEVSKIKKEILKGVTCLVSSYEFTPEGEVVVGDYLKRLDF